MLLHNIIILKILSTQINTFKMTNISNYMNKKVIYFTKDIPLSKNNLYSSKSYEESLELGKSSNCLASRR